MIEKLEFYHGAALVRLIEDSQCKNIGKYQLGYVVNGSRIVFMKYTTKATSPWRFTFSEDDIIRFTTALGNFKSCILVLVCGGDGMCAIPWIAAKKLLGNRPGWISAKRAFSGCYAVMGSQGTLKRRVALNHWPAIVFKEDEE